MKTVAFFNNKGGVGKTTLVYHLAWMLSQLGKRVLVVDLDPQANLTSMFLAEEELEHIWSIDQPTDQSIMFSLRPMIRGLGDIQQAPVKSINQNLDLIPGDLALAGFESNLSEAWGKCLDGQEPAFRITSAFYRIAHQVAVNKQADVVLIDVGPNFGAVNRAALICSDHVVVPLAPDLFSIQGLRNLGPILKDWRKAWDVRKSLNPDVELILPSGRMNPLGYVTTQFGTRDNRPVKAYEKWAKRIPETFEELVVAEPDQPPLSQVSDRFCLGQLKHYRSLMPMAMEARKPIFNLKPADGAIGSHIYSVQGCYTDFQRLANDILAKL